MIHNLLPTIIFFITYKLYNIFFATLLLIIFTILQIIYEYIMYKKISKINFFLTILILVLGSATLYFHDDKIIKLKLSIINFLVGISLIITTYTMNEVPVKKILNKRITLKENEWKEINNILGIYFIIIAIINIFIVYFFSTDVWIYFKFFNIICIIFIFLIIQYFYLSKNIKK